MSMDQGGTTLDAASRNAADRLAGQTARPGTDPRSVSRTVSPTGANMTGSADAGEYKPTGGMVDEAGNSYVFWLIGVTHFNDDWRFGPPG